MVEKFDLDLPRPQENIELFKTGGNRNEFAQIGWNKNLSVQFYGYIEGYKDSADTLVAFAIKAKDSKTLDTYIFPICFLYRQSIELQMKFIYLVYSNETKAKKQKALKKEGHRLIGMWNKIKPIISEVAGDNEVDSLNVVEEYIKQFHVFDLKSDMFRYPTTVTLNFSLSMKTA